MSRFVLAAGILAGAFITGCAVGPKYQRAAVPAPTAWSTEGPWRVAAPKDSVPKGAWWEVFKDEQLSQYERQLLAANPSLIAAKDSLDQARSLAVVSTAGYFPTVTTDPQGSRTRDSGYRPFASPPAPYVSLTEIPFAMNYEPDLFGRVRRNVESANANLQANVADLANVQLVLTAELAADYFSLRELDAEYQVLQEAVNNQQKGLDLVQNRERGGVATGLDVAQQATLLDSTIAQFSLVKQQRYQFEHAIVVLTGNPPAAFLVPVAALTATPPPVPLGVPSDVLERRPDVAAAERAMAFQNAQVGLATTAFYPQLTISGNGGLESVPISKLFSLPAIFWSVGSDLLEPVFNGGRLHANLAAAKSAYDQSVQNYRQTVLTAFQQVEDSLSNLNTLSEAYKQQQAAVADAQRALQIANNRYVGGVTTYLDVITAQTVLLANERLETQLLGQQMVNSVQLVKALGGYWDASQIQNEEVHPRAGQAIRQ